MFNKSNMLACAVAFFYCVSCASTDTPQEVKKEPTQKSKLARLLDKPDKFLDRDIEIEGVIRGVKHHNVTKSISMLTIRLVPPENIELLNKTTVAKNKYLFLNKLTDAENLFTQNFLPDTYLNHRVSLQLREMAFQFKIASRELQAMSYNLEAADRSEVAKAIKKISDAYSKFGDAYFSFEKAARLSSPGEEEEIAKPVQDKNHKFQNSLTNGAELLLDLAQNFQGSQNLLERGYYTFTPKKILNKNKSLELLTTSNLAAAYAWRQKKRGNLYLGKIHESIAAAMNELGQADKTLNKGLVDIAKALNKTAVHRISHHGFALKCAYIGYNNTHLARSAKQLKNINYSYPVRIRGQLLRSNLREEVDVLWLSAKSFEIDGLSMNLSFDDESRSLKSTVELYEWIQNADEKDGDGEEE